ncbi:MAG: sugar ABC transporter permease [Ktedonobacteraceae bacterium]
MATQPASQSVASAPPLTAEGRRRLRRGNTAPRGRKGETLAAYLFLLPYLLVLCVFILGVAIFGVGLSLFKIDLGFGTPEFVGLHYYQLLFSQLGDLGNSDFWTSMINVLKYTVGVVIGQTILALILAVVLNNAPIARGPFRTIFYLPALISSVATSLIFLWLYNPDGLINYLLSLVHIRGLDWLNNTTFALPSIILLNIWTTGAAFMIYFLAALQDIPPELNEAARVDGAGPLDVFWNITLPLLRPSVFLVVALGTIGAFQVFDQAKFMTNGGPANATLVPLLEIYNAGFQDGHFGLAAAMAVILFIIIFIVTLLQRRLIDPGSNS